MQILPSREQIQTWILAIEPFEYFERLVDRPGMLVLRAKDPVCEWRGLHLAVTDAAREAFRQDLGLLLAGGLDRVRYHTSLADMNNRAWYNLYTSGVRFQDWWTLSVEIEPLRHDSAVWVRFADHIVHVRLSNEATQTLLSELERSPRGGIKSSLPLMREAKPSSHSQALWFWDWPEDQRGG